MKFSAGKLPVYSPSTDQYPGAEIPTSLVVYSVALIVIVGATLVYAVSIQLAEDSFDMFGVGRMCMLAVAGFILPAFAANAILNHSRWSRVLIVLTTITLYVAAFFEHRYTTLLNPGSMFYLTALAGACVLALWLFATPTMNAYFAAVSGTEPQRVPAEPRPGGKALRGLQRLSSAFEWVLMGLALAAYVVAVAMVR